MHYNEFFWNNIQLSPEGEVNIYQDVKRQGIIYLPLFTDPEGDSCFSIYQIRQIKNAVLIFSSETFVN